VLGVATATASADVAVAANATASSAPTASESVAAAPAGEESVPSAKAATVLPAPPLPLRPGGHDSLAALGSSSGLASKGNSSKYRRCTQNLPPSESTGLRPCQPGRLRLRFGAAQKASATMASSAQPTRL